MLFTRDLRVHDHPALAAAVAEHGAVVPAFVFDDAMVRGGFNNPNRTGFLLECLADIDASLRTRGASLVFRRGDWATEVLRLAVTSGATTIHVSDDVSSFARSRLDRLTRRASQLRMAVRRHPGVATVPPGALVPAGSDHFKVFTPYYRQWRSATLRPMTPTPHRVVPPASLAPGVLPTLGEPTTGLRSEDVIPGGETAARKRFAAWTKGHLHEYAERHDDLAGDVTSRLSPYLHFGCLSPLEVTTTGYGEPGAESFLRQLCWRDFYLQILAARPVAAWSDYRPRGDTWHNRARMIVASFLTKDLYLDWRHGARHFLEFLVDGDLANNNLNWQWAAGTGADTNPHRVFNPTVQSRRFDPDGEYVRRFVPELRSVEGSSVHNPDATERARLGYVSPIVDHGEPIRRFRARRGSGGRS